MKPAEEMRMIGYTKLSSPDAFVICTAHGTILGTNGKKASSPEKYWRLYTEHGAETAAQMVARARKTKYVGFVK